MTAINVLKKEDSSVTLEYRGTEVKFILDAQNRPVPVSSGSSYRTLQRWEKRDIIARAAAILSSQKKTAKSKQ